SELLLDVNNMLVSNLNLRELVSAISVCLRRIIPHDLAGLALYNPVLKQLRLAAMDFPSNEDFFVEGEIIPLDGNPGGLAFTSRQTVLSDARQADDKLGSRFAAAGVKSSCIVPLISHDRALGVLGVSSLRENAFTKD